MTRSKPCTPSSATVTDDSRRGSSCATSALVARSSSSNSAISDVSTSSADTTFSVASLTDTAAFFRPCVCWKCAKKSRRDRASCKRSHIMRARRLASMYRRRTATRA